MTILNELYKLGWIMSKRLRWPGHVSRMEEGSSPFKILTSVPIEKRPLGSPRRRREYNIRMDLKQFDINKRRIGTIGEPL